MEKQKTQSEISKEERINQHVKEVAHLRSSISALRLNLDTISQQSGLDQDNLKREFRQEKIELTNTIQQLRRQLDEE
jgi:AraC-like DNA-binding protein